MRLPRRHILAAPALPLAALPAAAEDAAILAALAAWMDAVRVVEALAPLVVDVDEDAFVDAMDAVEDAAAAIAALPPHTPAGWAAKVFVLIHSTHGNPAGRLFAIDWQPPTDGPTVARLERALAADARRALPVLAADP